MARQWRIEYPGAYYHVFSRGNRHQKIFHSDKDRNTFIDLLGEMSDRFAIDVNAYVLMGNHYHLLLKTPDANLSKAMQWLGTTYTRRFHAHNRTDGHLFQGRFKSIVVENDAYLLQLSYYIHRNPLRAGIVQKLSDYKWSSYSYYATRKKAPEWMAVDLITAQMHSQNPYLEYRQNMQRYADEIDCAWEDVKHGLLYGSQKFVEACKKRFLKDLKDAELPQHNRLFKDDEPEPLARKAADAFGFDMNRALVPNSRVRHGIHQRDMVIYFLWETGKWSNRQIGDLMQLTHSNISRRVNLFRAALLEEPAKREEYARLRAKIKV